jgi:hypothetical protein
VQKFNLTRLLILSLLCCSVSYVYSQAYSRPNAWKKYRKELVVGIGASGFLGDLGGRNTIGKDNSPVDYEFSKTRMAAQVGFRYKFTKNINLNSGFNFLSVAGDDKLTTETYRQNRNLNFKSNIYELSTRIEFGITSFKRTGVYSLKSSLGRTNKRISYELIGFVGVGAFYHNPKGKDASGKYVSLYNMHTEGQGLPGGPKQYKRVGVAIPMGIALHVVLNKYWSVGAELSYRKTFTDYIDDVSGSYYDNTAIANAYGTQAAAMADPSLGQIAGATSPNADGTGAQRGDKNKDSYMSFQVTVGRFFPPKRSRTKLRSKF